MAIDEPTWHQYIPLTRLELTAGLAYSADEDLKRMVQWAADGWQIIEVRRMYVVLERTTPEQVIFLLDYQTCPDDEYYAICRTAGWIHVLSLSEKMHLFKASVGTRPLSSLYDESMVRRAQRQISHIALISSVVMVITWLLAMQILPWLWIVDRGMLGWVLAWIGMVGMYATTVMASYTVLPWLVYQVRRCGIKLSWSWRRAQMLVDGLYVTTGVLFGLSLAY